ncbi:MAG TPA: hypothetical protein EYH45_01680 [Candidatus Caldiarchaeum subterraneum]|uniref:Hsp20/alpha crystallin family protein n=1 Tax=Caldiarchaeum subterraneum TaxID=311458 RepID=A0A832ZVM9_CALS0|nr:hypothetical protein [Aigarchaeota archaeon]HIQ29256.1 hypothetical protein [Candidatus Caldarchaeum subterraneum]
MQERRKQTEIPSMFILYIIVALVVIALAGILLRFQQGLLGIILVALTAGLAFYWIRELSKTVKKSDWSNLLCELHEENGVISLVAQVPGPAENVKVEVMGKKLLLRGGLGFRRIVNLPFEARLTDMRYVNGILSAKLIRRESTAKTY